MAEGLRPPSLPPPTGRRRTQEPRARDAATVLFACPAALLEPLLAYGSSSPSFCKHRAASPLIFLLYRLTAEATARCPIWALEARNPGRWGICASWPGMKTPFGKAAAGQRSGTGTGHGSVSVTMMKRKAAHKKHRSRPTSQPRRNIVGCRIQHGWKDGDEPLTQWKGTVLDQIKGS